MECSSYIANISKLMTVTRHTYFSDKLFTSVHRNYTEKLSFVNKKASAYYRIF